MEWQENCKPPGVDNSRPSSVHTLLKPVVVFLSKMKPNGYFILLDFTQFSSMIILKKSAAH